MIDTNDVIHLLSTTATKIQPYDANTAFRMSRLADTIKEGNAVTIDAWATQNLYSLIAPETIIARFKQQHADTADRGLLQLLRWGRIFLALLALIITSYGLAQAAASYQQIRPDQAQLSFLYLWQQGFYGRLPAFFSPSSLATIDTMLLILVLLFSLATMLFSREERQKREDERQREDEEAQLLRSDMDHTLAATSLYLSLQHRALTTPDHMEQVARGLDKLERRMEEKFTHLADRFDSTTQQVTVRFDGLIRGATSTFEDMTRQTSKTLADTTNNLSKQLDQTSQHVTDDITLLLKDTTARYDGMSQQLMQSFASITSDLQRQLLEGSKYLKDMGQLTSGVVQTAQQVQEAAKLLKDQNSQLSEHLGQLVGPTTALAQQQEALLERVGSALASLQEGATSLREVGKQQERWGTDLRNILDTLDLSIEHATEVVMQAGDANTRQDHFLSTMRQEREAYADLVKRLTDVLEEEHHTVNE